MPTPNGGLITENNRQYYAGAQSFLSTANQTVFGPTTFDTNLVFGSYNPVEPNYSLNNYKLYTAAPGDLVYTEYTANYSITDNKITFATGLALNTAVAVQLKSQTGGSYGNKDAVGNTVEENWGSYSYTKLNDVISNFMVAYVGTGKIISDVKRTDVVFFAKRAMQEFSYDTLKSIKSQELSIPETLSLTIPQDYVNYVQLSWVDSSGVKHIIYPTRVTSNPSELPIQDNTGQPTQDQAGTNLLSQQSLTEERWQSQDQTNNWRPDDYKYPLNKGIIGQRYGLQPEEAQVNGKFTINERTGSFSFSSDLAGRLIILEYVSDGLAVDLDMKLPKMAEQAMYMHILTLLYKTTSDP